MAPPRKPTGNGAPAGTGKRKNVDVGMKQPFADSRMVEAFFPAFLAACGRAAGIDFEALRQLSGELPRSARKRLGDLASGGGRIRLGAAFPCRARDSARFRPGDCRFRAPG